jgi:hypothetical protein
MANSNGWGDGSANNNIGWGQGAVNNNISWGKSHIDSWSGATDIDGGNAPINSVTPALSGTAQEGQTLTCSTGTWSGTPTYTYQWKRNGSNIGSATNSTYTLITADVGQSIKCTVTATNALGSSNADSNTVTPTSSTDPDAQAFITAASITNPTQQSAINQLVVDLKGYSIWTKMKALYPFVGGTASTHKFNLKNPLDTDAAFRLVFSGGWTHSSTGATPNGTNGYADTKLVAQGILGLNSTSFGVYSRTNVDIIAPSIGNVTGGLGSECSLWLRIGNNTVARVNSPNYPSISNLDSKGFFIANRIISSEIKVQIRNVQYTGTFNTSNSLSTNTFKIGGVSPGYFDTKELAFSFIGDGLTDTEAANLYTAVQAFQTTLGRSIGTQTVSDADAQAFVTNAGIVDQVEANAINNLVIGMKADGLWTKMKAVYPFVGGTASTHKFNLKDPRDLDAAYRLVFNGGYTHNNLGITGNGTNAYADTKLIPNSGALTQNSTHISVYSRTNKSNSNECLIGSATAAFSNNGLLILAYANDPYIMVNNSTLTNGTGFNTTGLLTATRTTSTNQKLFRNTSTLINATSNSTGLSNGRILLNAFVENNISISRYAPHNLAFASIGDGLTDTDATNLNTRVTTFQTALNRNV